MKFKVIPLLFVAVMGLVPFAAAAQTKIGFVDSDRLMREATPAVRAQQRLEKEFEQREQELQRIARDLQNMQEEMERNSLTMSESQRRDRERSFNDLSRDFQRKQREFREDLNQRRNEELATVLDRANAAIKQVAEAEKFDVILQEVVFVSPSIDITDRVIKALESGR